MRAIIANLCMAEDGIVDRPERWLPAPALGGVIDDLAAGANTVLLGRRTYEQYAGSLGGVRKLVIASTPVAYQPGSEVLKGDPRRVLAALKQVPGPDLHVIGSLGLIRSLLRWRLLDDVTLRIHPVRAGQGTALDRRSFKLISLCAGLSGTLEATYKVHYAATGALSSVDSTGRWGGTRRTATVPSTPRTAIKAHA
ncbi:dihydrofolate reductase family protein [Kribbella sp. NPDC051587]|uniref:dihydrofolate reductase family protein n=1 Tax=Kribbella sp. NPDC051587 TaxID=3364119 RepID=UPI00379E33A8